MNKILELIEPEIYEIEAHLSDAFWKIWTWSEQNALESNRQAPWYKEVQRQKRLKKINSCPKSRQFEAFSKNWALQQAQFNEYLDSLPSINSSLRI